MSGAFAFYGYSDDTAICIRPNGSYADVGAYDRPAVGTLTAPDGSAVHVVVMYATYNVAGCWAVGLMPLACDDGEHEAREMPGWTNSVCFERNGDPDYSARMTVFAPEGTVFRWEGDE